MERTKTIGSKLPFLSLATQKWAAFHALRTNSRSEPITSGSSPAPASQAATVDLPHPGSPVTSRNLSVSRDSHPTTSLKAHLRPEKPVARLAISSEIRTRGIHPSIGREVRKLEHVPHRMPWSA